MNALMIAGVVVAVPPLRRAVVKPVAKLAVKGGLAVVDTAKGAVNDLGSVYSEAQEERRGTTKASSDGRGRARKTAAAA